MLTLSCRLWCVRSLDKAPTANRRSRMPATDQRLQERYVWEKTRRTFVCLLLLPYPESMASDTHATGVTSLSYFGVGDGNATAPSTGHFVRNGAGVRSVRMRLWRARVIGCFRLTATRVRSRSPEAFYNSLEMATEVFCLQRMHHVRDAAVRAVILCDSENSRCLSLPLYSPL